MMPNGIQMEKVKRGTVGEGLGYLSKKWSFDVQSSSWILGRRPRVGMGKIIPAVFNGHC